MILVTGDAMVDRYWFGVVERCSPEAPVPVLVKEREEDREGGAANVARNVEAMGVRVRRVFSRDYATNPVTKLRLIARTQQIARVDFEPHQEPIDLDELGRVCAGCEIAILSDYAKGALMNVRSVIAVLRSNHVRVLVDPKGDDAESYSGVDLLKPNHYEMRMLVGAWRDENDLERRAHALCHKHAIRAIVMTRGVRGMTLFHAGARHDVAGRKLELSDVSGAGDTAIAALAVALYEGSDFVSAMMFANDAAGVSVSRFGTTIVSRDEVVT